MPLALRILRLLSVRDLLRGTRLASQAHKTLTHHPNLWRHHALALTASDPVAPRAPADEDGWEPLYRSLHFREANFKHGVPQVVRFLHGHTGFVTSLILRGKRLISGSYDETIRVWDITAGEEKKCLQVKKPVSCLDMLTDVRLVLILVQIS